MKNLGVVLAASVAATLASGCFPGSYHAQRHGLFSGDTELHSQYAHTKVKKHSVKKCPRQCPGEKATHRVYYKKHTQASCSHGSCKS